MADVTATPDGGASITITQGETTGLKALANQHLPALQRFTSWFSKDVAPELHEAADFLKSLAANPPEGSTLTVTPAQAETLRGLLQAHVPDFSQVLAVVESPVVRELFTFAKALLNMAGFWRRTARDDEAQAKQVLDAAVAALRNCQRAGVATVTVAEALTMLGAGPETAPAPEMPVLDPRADAVTGCLPVTPR